MPNKVSKMQGRKYLSKFNIEWLNVERYKKWLRAVEKSDEYARCCVCRVEFDIGNIGITAVESHSKGAKHKRLLAPENPKQPTLQFENIDFHMRSYVL